MLRIVEVVVRIVDPTIRSRFSRWGRVKSPNKETLAEASSSTEGTTLSTEVKASSIEVDTWMTAERPRDPRGGDRVPRG
jgi:hypothetical protein